VRCLVKRQGPATDEALAVYTRLVCSVLGRGYQDDQDDETAGTVQALREVMFKTAGQYRVRGDKRVSAEVAELLMATHHMHMMLATRSSGLKDLTAKCAITLVKYPQYIPQDKAFYLAGNLAREQGNNNLAFLLLNRYVDLAEAIDAADPSYVDNSQFEDADAVPLNGPLPANHYLQDEVT
jgi:intraflagellar transport protein 172